MMDVAAVLDYVWKQKPQKDKIIRKRYLICMNVSFGYLSQRKPSVTSCLIYSKSKPFMVCFIHKDC